jgi:hypothetical protein
MKKINILNISLIALLAISIFSCKKKGCMDVNAINYNSEAKKDDASCTYYTSAIIKTVTVTYPAMDGSYSWDSDVTIDSLPDLHLEASIYDWDNLSNDTLHKSDTVINASSPYTFTTNLTISAENLSESIDFELSDFDPSSFGGAGYSNWMGSNYISLDEYTSNSSSLFSSYSGDPYPTSITETSSFGDIQFTYEIEWKE